MRSLSAPAKSLPTTATASAAATWRASRCSATVRAAARPISARCDHRASKVYDGNQGANITSRSLIGVPASDTATVSCTGGSATVENQNFGNNKAVLDTGMGLTGADASNYRVNSSAWPAPRRSTIAFLMAASMCPPSFTMALSFRPSCHLTASCISFQKPDRAAPCSRTSRRNNHSTAMRPERCHVHIRPMPVEVPLFWRSRGLARLAAFA